MNKLWLSTFKAFIYKEFLEVLSTMKGLSLVCILTILVTQYATINQVVNSGMNKSIIEEQISFLMVYVVTMIFFFHGHTLIDRFIHEERMNKTIHVILASGMPKTAIWTAKMFVTIVTSEVISLLSVGLNIIMVRVVYNVSVKFNVISFLLVFVTVPILCFGILAIISVAYWYFKNVKIFGFLFPMIMFFGIWNLSIKLSNVLIPKIFLSISTIIGIILLYISFLLVKKIPKERIANME